MLHFNWNKLDNVASEAVRAAINSKLSTLCDDTWHVNPNVKTQTNVKNEISASSPSASASVEDVKFSTTARASKKKVIGTPEEQLHSKELHLSHKHEVCSSVATTLKLENATSEHYNLQHEHLEQAESTATLTTPATATIAIANNYAHDERKETMSANDNNSSSKNKKQNKQATDSFRGSKNMLHLPNTTTTNITTTTPSSSLTTTPLLPKEPLTPQYTSHSFQEQHEWQQRQEEKHEQYNKYKEQGKHVNMEESTRGTATWTKALSINTQISSKELVSPTHIVNTSGTGIETGATSCTPVQSTSAILSSTLCSQTSSSSACISATQHVIELLSSPDTMKGNANRLFYINELQVTELSWGSSSPFIEFVEFSSALDHEPDLAHELNTNTSQNSKCLQDTQVKEDESTDRVAEWCGSDGLFIRLHLTYGGDMHLSLSVSVTYDIKFSSITLPVSLPVKAAISGLDLDCFVCVNLHKSSCKIWLENTETSASPINRLKITTTFGSNERVNTRHRRGVNHSNAFDAKESTFDKSVCSAQNQSCESTCQNVLTNMTCDENRFANKENFNNNFDNNMMYANSTNFDVDSLSSNYVDSGDSFDEENTDESDDDDDDEEEEEEEESSSDDSSSDANDYDAVFTDEKVISQFILDELRALLREKLIAPHFLNIPIPPVKHQERHL